MNEPWPTEQQAIEHSIRVQRERDEWKQRAEQAESEIEKLRAQLAAVPVQALRALWSNDLLPYLEHTAALREVREWLDSQAVQPVV